MCRNLLGTQQVGSASYKSWNIPEPSVGRGDRTEDLVGKEWSKGCGGPVLGDCSHSLHSPTGLTGGDLVAGGPPSPPSGVTGWQPQVHQAGALQLAPWCTYLEAKRGMES